MSKLTSALNQLKQAHDILGELQSAGVDVDRLIGISNAQGPLAKTFHTILTVGAVSSDIIDEIRANPVAPKALPPKRPVATKTRKKSSEKT